MGDSLSDRGRGLEEEFFRKRDAQLIAERRRHEETQQNRAAMAAACGIKNEKVLDKLLDSGMTPGAFASLRILPLVEVAWADGALDDKEKMAVLDGAVKIGLKEGSPEYALLESWLKEPPPAKLLNVWIHYIEGLHEVLTPQELKDLKSALLDRATQVAAAAGGFLGFSKISPEEQAVLKKMENAFKS